MGSVTSKRPPQPTFKWVWVLVNNNGVTERRLVKRYSNDLAKKAK